ncbi:hypothetical protein BT63DRAFT_417173 [Microthyrium microscopicum]|uniref:Tcp11-domain-containing protein n=1 Tax=Microthyrium microscopicum TaxID=703497 RepID=A0A6A6TZX0_9PEZI|nr:hypothetical protein BT63DRAFT_417173 [Microthyrium microscopicum]
MLCDSQDMAGDAWECDKASTYNENNRRQPTAPRDSRCPGELEYEGANGIFMPQFTASRSLSGQRKPRRPVKGSRGVSPRQRKGQPKRTKPDFSSFDGELCQHLFELLERRGNPKFREAYQHFTSDNVEPPITQQSLSELEINSIVNNSKLRHDINYDRELHFRPNQEGDDAKRKFKSQRSYWLAITAEIELYNILLRGLDTEASEVMTLSGAIKKSQRRLPKLFKAVKEILLALVPERDQSQVHDNLDVDIMMQEIERTMLNFVLKAEWLAQLLKTHCAPMRDVMIDGMVTLMRKGDPKSVSAGLCEIFAVLEAMKLDVANHQIRHLRALLIEDTVNFETRYHIGRIKKAKFDPEPPRQWFQQVSFSYEVEVCKVEANSNNAFQALVITFVDELLSGKDLGVRLPATFSLDLNRINAIQSEILSEIHLAICFRLFRECLDGESPDNYRLPRLAEEAVKARLKAIMNGCSLASALPNLAVEIAHQVGQLSGESEDSSAHVDMRLVEEAQQLLEQWLFPDSEEFQDVQLQVRHTLISQIFAAGNKYMQISLWDIFNALVPYSSPNSLPPPPLPTAILPATSTSAPVVYQCMGSPPNLYTELANKLSHLLILHWRIWGPLAYENLDDSESEGSVSMPGTPLDCNGDITPDQRIHIVIDSNDKSTEELYSTLKPT